MLKSDENIGTLREDESGCKHVGVLEFNSLNTERRKDYLERTWFTPFVIFINSC